MPLVNKEYDDFIKKVAVFSCGSKIIHIPFQYYNEKVWVKQGKYNNIQHRCYNTEFRMAIGILHKKQN